MQAKRLLEAYAQVFAPHSPSLLASAPGRLNLLGEHTDYNEGFVLPMAIDSRITLVGGLNGTNEVQLYSLNFKARDSFSLKDIPLSTKNTWSNYPRGVCALLLAAGYPLQGMNIVLGGDVPLGAGLSSSAALEVATALFINELQGLQLGPLELVQLAQRAENEFVGVACGIMDQFVSMLGKKNHVLFLDSRSLNYELIPARFAQLGYSVVVINSGVERALVDSEYNKRQQECGQAVKILQTKLPGINSLRDVGSKHLSLLEALPAPLAERALHVVTENERVLAGVQALRNDDLLSFGQLLNESQESLRHNYEVSSPELDLLVELSRSIPGALGAKMTGAGFGGSMLALLPQTAVLALKTKIFSQYPKLTGLTPELYVYQACSGAKVSTISNI